MNGDTGNPSGPDKSLAAIVHAGMTTSKTASTTDRAAALRIELFKLLNDSIHTFDNIAPIITKYFANDMLDHQRHLVYEASNRAIDKPAAHPWQWMQRYFDEKGSIQGLMDSLDVVPGDAGAQGPKSVTFKLDIPKFLANALDFRPDPAGTYKDDGKWPRTPVTLFDRMKRALNELKLTAHSNEDSIRQGCVYAIESLDKNDQEMRAVFKELIELKDRSDRPR